MRVVLDTNVVVSALLSPGGPPAALLRSWRERRIEVLASEASLAELAGVLARPRIARRLGWSTAERRDFLHSFGDATLLVTPDVSIDVIAADPPDNRFLELALAGAAEYLVTGDQHLAALGAFEGIPMVTPAQFVAVLAAG